MTRASAHITHQSKRVIARNTHVRDPQLRAARSRRRRGRGRTSRATGPRACTPRRARRGTCPTNSQARYRRRNPRNVKLGDGLRLERDVDVADRRRPARARRPGRAARASARARRPTPRRRRRHRRRRHRRGPPKRIAAGLVVRVRSAISALRSSSSSRPRHAAGRDAVDARVVDDLLLDRVDALGVVARPREQQAVELAARGQLFVRARVDDLALVDDDDAIGERQRRAPVRDEQRGARARDPAQRRVDLLLDAGVDRRRRVVEQQDLRDRRGAPAPSATRWR